MRITEIKQTEAKLLLVEGKLTNGDAETLKRIVGQIAAGQNIAVDLSGVTFIDPGGAIVLRELQENGVEITGANFFIKAVIDAHNDNK